MPVFLPRLAQKRLHLKTFAILILFFASVSTGIIFAHSQDKASILPLSVQEQLRPLILIDQFGYLPDIPKISVITQHGQGANSELLSEDFRDQYEVVNVSNGEVIYEGKAELWNDGSVHSQSGDRAAWLDFSSVNQPGTYLIRNKRTGYSSAPFEIAEDVYRKILSVVTRMFYYQRSGFPKQPPYADLRWVDDEAFLGPNQDTEARFVDDKNNNNLRRDVRGGWFDAGDTNKYVTFATTAVNQLLDAYRDNPSLWGDDFNLPESGNGIPDLVDEILYELDWLKRMQDNDGGVFIKVGTLDYQMFERPSLDDRPRFYGPKCSSSTIDVATMFAHASLVLQNLPTQSAYANDLRSRAVMAWNWYHKNEKSDACDSQEIKSGDADRSIQEQQETSITAAIYLLALTKNSTYSDYIDNNIELISECLYCHDTWYPYHVNFADALLYYASLPTADQNIKNLVRERLSQLAKVSPTYASGDELDPYRGYMPDDQYHWGSNAIKALYGIANCDAYTISGNSILREGYQERCLDVLHYFHGVNPLDLVYLSNMYAYGADRSINELHHDWFGQGIYDSALTSSSGSPPGYLPGGPNRNYTGTAPIDLEYPMRAYLDSNNKRHDMKMWEISEPAIYYQSAYLKLLSRLCS